MYTVQCTPYNGQSSLYKIFESITWHPNKIIYIVRDNSPEAIPLLFLYNDRCHQQTSYPQFPLGVHRDALLPIPSHTVRNITQAFCWFNISRLPDTYPFPLHYGWCMFMISTSSTYVHVSSIEHTVNISTKIPFLKSTFYELDIITVLCIFIY